MLCELWRLFTIIAWWQRIEEVKVEQKYGHKIRNASTIKWFQAINSLVLRLLTKREMNFHDEAVIFFLSFSLTIFFSSRNKKITQKHFLFMMKHLSDINQTSQSTLLSSMGNFSESSHSHHIIRIVYKTAFTTSFREMPAVRYIAEKVTNFSQTQKLIGLKKNGRRW